MQAATWVGRFFVSPITFLKSITSHWDMRTVEHNLQVLFLLHEIFFTFSLIEKECYKDLMVKYTFEVDECGKFYSRANKDIESIRKYMRRRYCTPNMKRYLKPYQIIENLCAVTNSEIGED